MKKPQLVLGGDSFGHDLEIQAVAERDNGAHDRSIVRVIADIGDERAVYLECVERKSLQVVR